MDESTAWFLSYVRGRRLMMAGGGVALAALGVVVIVVHHGSANLNIGMGGVTLVGVLLALGSLADRTVLREVLPLLSRPYRLFSVVLLSLLFTCASCTSGKVAVPSSSTTTSKASTTASGHLCPVPDTFPATYSGRGGVLAVSATADPGVSTSRLTSFFLSKLHAVAGCITSVTESTSHGWLFVYVYVKAQKLHAVRPEIAGIFRDSGLFAVVKTD